MFAQRLLNRVQALGYRGQEKRLTRKEEYGIKEECYGNVFTIPENEREEIADELDSYD